MPRCSITVLKREFYPDLADEYCGRETGPCDRFADGQEFVIDSMDQPSGFCPAAWRDITPQVGVLMRGGNFVPWMDDDDTIVLCCTDGIRPVVFEVRRLDQ